tara:strand:- start:237 stop:1151 length:915 start_codon:yes stop_codon:yes gene_type:complete
MSTTYKPAPFIEGAQQNYVDLLTQLVGQAPGSNIYDADGNVTGTVPTLDQLGPNIANQNILTKEAQQLAANQAGLGQLTFDPVTGAVTGAGAGTGVAGYQPYLDQATAYSGPNAYKQFMSPYQQDVIDTTLAEYDIQAAKGAQGTAADAIAAGAFGGGREGVRRAEYGAASDRNRAATQAKLLQEGFGTAQNLAAQAFNQQRNLASLQPSLAASNIQNLGGAGTSNLAYEQALLDAEQQRNQLAYKEPFDRLGIYGTGIASMMSGAPYTTTTIGSGAGNVGPLSSELSAGLSAYGLGSIFGSRG